MIYSSGNGPNGCHLAGFSEDGAFARQFVATHPPPTLPAPFSVEHSLDCCFGGLVTRRHNEVRDAFGDLASLVWSPVIKKPVVCDGSAGADTLITDLCVRGVWEPQTEALFDIRVVDTDAQSYLTRSSHDVLCSAEGEKKCKYLRLVRLDVPHLLLCVFL